MQSLRSRQKIKRREDMLIAARTLFVEKGYSKTTMEAIAEHADVGVATVYTYFTNKEGVFAALARMDMSELKVEGDAALQDLPSDPVVAVHRLLDIYIKVHEYISYEVVRDFNLGVMKEGPIREVAGWMHDWQMSQLGEALRTGQESGAVSKTLVVRDAAEIICDLLARYYDRAFSDESERKARANLKRWVALIFDNWRVG